MAATRRKTARRSTAVRNGSGNSSFGLILGAFRHQRVASILWIAFAVAWLSAARGGYTGGFFSAANMAAVAGVCLWALAILRKAEKKLRSPPMTLEQRIEAIRKLSMRSPAVAERIAAPIARVAEEKELVIKAAAKPTKRPRKRRFRASMRKAIGGFFRIIRRAVKTAFRGKNPYYYAAAAAAIALMHFSASYFDVFLSVAFPIVEKEQAAIEKAKIDIAAVAVPPSYAKLQPVELSDEGDKRLFSGDATEVLAGSGISINGSVSSGEYEVEMDGKREKIFVGEDGKFSFAGKIEKSGAAVLKKDGKSLAAWKFRAVKDISPKIKFAESPKKAERNTVKLSYDAVDDFGVQSVSLRIAPLIIGGTEENRPFEIPLSSPDSKTSKQTLFEDFTFSPWAGLPVEMRLVARDAAGNVSMSDAAKFILPEKEFLHPFARVLADERKKLSRRTDEDACNETANTMVSIARQSSSYNNDPVVTMALRAGAVRLVLDKSNEAAVDSVRDILWQSAVRIEDGTVGAARSMLRLSQKELYGKLEKNPLPEEAAREVDRAKTALARYLSELSAIEQKASSDVRTDLFTGHDLWVLSADEVVEKMDEIRMLTISGDYASAKAKLTTVQSLTEILRPIPFSGPAERQQLLKQIVSLNAILRAQRLLLERTADEKAEKGLAEKQKALLKELKGLESDYYGFSDSAEAVSKAMSDAAAMISVGTYGDAAQKQKEAVDSLKSAARGLGEQLKAIMAAGSETQDMGGGVVGAAGILINDGYMETPDDMSLDRAKEIIDELQRKKDKNIKSKSEGGRTDELLRNF